MSAPRLAASAVGAVAALSPAVASAHGGESGVSTSLASELPGFAGLLILLGLPYAAGVRRVWRRAGRGHGVAMWEAVSFAGGLIVLAVAFIGPALVPVTDEFSGHMGQHLLLLVVAAPLLAFGNPGVAFAWWARGVGAIALTRSAHRLSRSPVVCAALSPMALLVIYVTVVWAWHLPALYDAAARHPALHATEHLSMLVVSFVFWWRVRRLEVGVGQRQVVAFFMLFAVMFPELVLGAFITFAREPLFESHRLATEARGGDPVADQQIGGLVMLMLGGLVYAGAALGGLLHFLSQDARSVLGQRERRA